MPQPSKIVLTNDDRTRLQALAPAFGLVVRESDADSLELHDVATGTSKVLAKDTGWVRLLSELCGRSAPWLCFRIGQSCRDTFLGLPDGRLIRVAELYTTDRSRQGYVH